LVPTPWTESRAAAARGTTVITGAETGAATDCTEDQTAIDGEAEAAAAVAVMDTTVGSETVGSAGVTAAGRGVTDGASSRMDVTEGPEFRDDASECVGSAGSMADTADCLRPRDGLASLLGAAGEFGREASAVAGSPSEAEPE
jgi:hypothetical protein